MAEHARLFMSLTSATSGEIKGESLDREMRDWIELEDWNWSIKAAKNDSDLAEPSVLSITKRLDRATPAMLKAMQLATPLKALIKVEDSSQQMFALTLELWDARIISYKVDVKEDDKSVEIEEDWDINYTTVDFEYQPDKQSGKVEVSMERPAGASNTSPNDRLSKFLALSKDLDMKVQDLTSLWDELKKAVEEDAKKTADDKNKKKDED